MDWQTNYIDKRLDGWINGPTNRWIDEQIERRIDGHVYWSVCSSVCVCSRSQVLPLPVAEINSCTSLVPDGATFSTSFSYNTKKIIFTQLHSFVDSRVFPFSRDQQESIPAWCVPPAYSHHLVSVRGGVAYTSLPDTPPPWTDTWRLSSGDTQKWWRLLKPYLL